MIMHGKHYVHLGIMTALSFIAMYVLMYAMVDRFSNVFNNFNQVYMAALMAAPMVLIELLVMREMYQQKEINIAIGIASVLVLIGAFALIRGQTGIGDAQFLRSMIPHHAGAILMCEQAPIQHAEVKKLCTEIIKSQQEEISRMKELLTKLN